MSSRLRAPLLFLAVALLAAACEAQPIASPSSSAVLSTTPRPTASPRPATSYPLTLIDDAGRSVIVEADPRRIISLAPSNTEIVCALGGCDELVGVNDFRDGFPAEVTAAIEGVPDVASFTGVDHEMVVAQEPDLILAAGNELTSSADIQALDELGLTVMVLYPESLDEVYADIELVAQAIDAGAQADELIADMRDRVAGVREAVGGAERPRTFYEVGLFGGVIYTAGEDSFLASLLELAGAEPITGDAVSTAIQAEDLVVADPQVILLGDAAYDPSITPEAVAARPGWGEMTAVRDGRVLPMPEDILITRPGPRVVEGLEALAAAIHPDLVDS